MKEELLRLKLEKKQLASQITTLKSQRKSVPNGYVKGLDGCQLQFRIKHIAHCLLRGREMCQIESHYRYHTDSRHAYCLKRAQEIVKEVQEKAAVTDEATAAAAAAT